MEQPPFPPPSFGSSWRVLLSQLRNLFQLSRSAVQWLRHRNWPWLRRVAEWAGSNRLLLCWTLSIGSFSLIHWYYHSDPQDDARWRRIEAAHDTEHCPTHAPKDGPFVSRFEYLVTPAGDIVQTCVFFPNPDYFGVSDFGRPSKFPSQHKKQHRQPGGPQRSDSVHSGRASVTIWEDEEHDPKEDGFAAANTESGRRSDVFDETLPSDILADDSLTVADGSDPSIFDSAKESSPLPTSAYASDSETVLRSATKKMSSSSETARRRLTIGPSVTGGVSGMSRSKSAQNTSDMRSGFTTNSSQTSTKHRNRKAQRVYVRESSEVPIVRGIIYFCHGYGSNIMGDVYWHLAQLASTMEGYAIISVEYPNHGRSDGLYVYIPSWNKMIDSVESIFHELRDKYWPKSIREKYSIPTFLFGQSMGGAVALFLARRLEQRRAERARRRKRMMSRVPLNKVDQKNEKEEEHKSGGSESMMKEKSREMADDEEDEEEEVSEDGSVEDIDALRGVILQAPMCHISEKQRLHPIIETALRTLAFLLPTYPITPDANGEDDDEAGGTWSYWATHNSEVQRWLAESPLYYNRPIRLGTALNLLKVTENISANIKVLIGNPKVSVLIQHGSLDRITSPTHSKYFFQSCISNDKTLIIYQNQFHKLMIEPEFRRIVFDDIERWLYQRTGAAQGRLALSKRRVCNRYIFKQSMHDN